ncbi:XdhC family protein [Effusibacillus consociatus]|uniref:XdhC family protein n=1 Tax=Effusibacillus consociatus TaxID=1117041 RepID=A0ABV9PZQ8_9BACL
MLDIVEGLKLCRDRKERAVLATILEVEGSAYRREGARCLISESGRIIGTLSGGCVEGDLFEHARAVMETGVSRTVRYDFRPEGDIFWGLGLGCNGALTIWLQSFDPIHHSEQAEQLVQDFQNRVSSMEAYTIGIVVESEDRIKLPVGTQIILNEADRDLHGFHRSSYRLKDTVIDGVSVKLFIEPVKPRPRLVIFGAGPDAVPLVRQAKALDWHVTVADHRKDYANRKNFPEVDELVITGRGDCSELPVGEETYVVVMTHNFELDRTLVQNMLPRPIPYLGVLGSRNRIERMLDEILLSGVELKEKCLKKLHSPVGLDIGAESPEEIALSILAEMVCRKNGRNGQSLKFRKEPLHERNKGIESVPVGA